MTLEVSETDFEDEQKGGECLAERSGIVGRSSNSLRWTVCRYRREARCRWKIVLVHELCVSPPRAYLTVPVNDDIRSLAICREKSQRLEGWTHYSCNRLWVWLALFLCHQTLRASQNALS
jgi:hypothetical protein